MGQLKILIDQGGIKKINVFSATFELACNL